MSGTKTIGAVAVFVVALFAVALPANAANIVVSPTTVAAGGHVRLTGDVLAGGTLGCPAGDSVTLISDAFKGLGEFAGQAAVSIPVNASGRFTRTVTLASDVSPGSYTISGRCGGGNLGVEATLVVSLPGTGAPRDLPGLLTAAALFVLVGVVLLTAARYRTRCLRSP